MSNLKDIEVILDEMDSKMASIEAVMDMMEEGISADEIIETEEYQKATKNVN